MRKTVKNKITLSEGQTVKWIICQHCNKPVYGLVTGEAIMPDRIWTKKWVVNWSETKKKVKKGGSK